LSNYPAYVRFSGDEIPMKFDSRTMGGLYDAGVLDAQKVRDVTREIRELQMKLEKRAKERTDLGYAP